MSHSEQSEDYWPGYVDALTSMVQVLAFVMMLLAMAVFVLSQNVSKSAVQAIAKAAKVDVPANASVKDLTAMVVEQVQKQEALAAQAANASPTPKAPPTPETAKPETPVPDDAPKAGASSQPVRSSASLAPKRPPASAQDAKNTVFRFQPRGFRVDAAITEQADKFVAENNLANSKVRLTIQAYASESEGSVSETRRFAYYRALTARKELVDRKVPAANITINIFDTQNKDQGASVEIIISPDAAP